MASPPLRPKEELATSPAGCAVSASSPKPLERASGTPFGQALAARAWLESSTCVASPSDMARWILVAGVEDWAASESQGLWHRRHGWQRSPRSRRTRRLVAPLWHRIQMAQTLKAPPPAG